MQKHKMVQSNLLRNSIAAYFAAIEIHNKPNIEYRYEAVTLLLMNAWELILKAFIRKYIKSRSIFENDGHTISFDKALNYTNEYINSITPKSFIATKENLSLVETYRNNIVHYYNEALEPYIFMIIARAALNYVDFVKKYFNKDIIENEGLFIMPLGFKLPFKPEDFFSKKAADYVTSEESKRFINTIVKSITDLKDQGISDSVVLGFDIFLNQVKKMPNADLLIAIEEIDKANATFAKTNKIQITNESDAPKYQLTEDQISEMYPYTYEEVRLLCKQFYSDCIINSSFHSRMKVAKKDISLAFGRKLDPKSLGKPEKYLFSTKIFDYLDKSYTRKK